MCLSQKNPAPRPRPSGRNSLKNTKRSNQLNDSNISYNEALEILLQIVKTLWCKTITAIMCYFKTFFSHLLLYSAAKRLFCHDTRCGETTSHLLNNFDHSGSEGRQLFLYEAKIHLNFSKPFSKIRLRST